jgi:hypothetical protein
MKNLKVTKGLLWVVTALGGYLVTQGVVTGEELSSLENIIGLVLAGGGLTANGLIYILGAIPATLVSKAYDKAAATYGKAQVDNILNQLDNVIDTVAMFNGKVDEMLEALKLDRDIKEELGVYEKISQDLKDRL